MYKNQSKVNENGKQRNIWCPVAWQQVGGWGLMYSTLIIMVRFVVVLKERETKRKHGQGRKEKENKRKKRKERM